MDGPTHLDEQVAKPTDGRPWAFGEELRETAAGDELHREVLPPVVFADFIDGQNVRVVEVRRRLGLLLEPDAIRLTGELAAQNHLDGDGPVQTHLPGLEDDAHAAAGDFFDEFIVAEIADAIRQLRLAA